MTDYTAAGAGTEGYNGVYELAGTHNEKDYWKMVDEEYYIFAVVMGPNTDKWNMSTILLMDGAMAAYAGGDVTATPLTSDGAWIVVNGASDAPTVTGDAPEPSTSATGYLSLNSKFW